MINQKKTDREIKMEEDFKPLGHWEAVVINEQTEGNRGVTITTKYKSRNGDILDNIAHKIKLDLITNLKYGFTNPIRVIIEKEGKLKIADEVQSYDKKDENIVKFMK
jgi:hypothetical protein